MNFIIITYYKQQINKMNVRLAKCGSCNNIIDLSYGYNVRRTCDKYVCSAGCSKKLIDSIARQDPRFENPYIWHECSNLLMKKSTSSINLNEQNYEYPPALTFEPVVKNISSDMENNININTEPDFWNYKGAGLVICSFILFALLSL